MTDIIDRTIKASQLPPELRGISIPMHGLADRASVDRGTGSRDFGRLSMSATTRPHMIADEFLLWAEQPLPTGVREC